jgi:hypothetical protein
MMKSTKNSTWQEHAYNRLGKAMTVLFRNWGPSISFSDLLCTPPTYDALSAKDHTQRVHRYNSYCACCGPAAGLPDGTVLMRHNLQPKFVFDLRHKNVLVRRDVDAFLQEESQRLVSSEKLASVLEERLKVAPWNF